MHDSGFHILLPSGKMIDSRREVRALPIVIDGRELYVNVIELVIEDFNFILSMDMLSKYEAMIDCKRRQMTFTPSGGVPFMPKKVVFCATCTLDLNIEGSRSIESRWCGFFGKHH